MPKKRFELLWDCSHNALNVARLPIPPLRLYFAQMFSRLSCVEAVLKRVKSFFEAKGESTLAKKNFGFTSPDSCAILLWGLHFDN